MFTSNGLSKRACFICGAKDDVLEVRFKDDQSQVTLCPRHLMDQVRKRSGAHAAPAGEATANKADANAAGVQGG